MNRREAIKKMIYGAFGLSAAWLGFTAYGRKAAPFPGPIAGSGESHDGADSNTTTFPGAQSRQSKNNNMKVLLVNGSPNQYGCTFTALTEVASSLEKSGVGTDILWLGKGPINGCMGCRACAKTGKCVIDDVVNETLGKVEGYDGFVIGSPVHYAAASGFITPFMDRLFYAGSGKMAYKPGAAIVSCRRAGSTAALDQLNKYFTINNMPLVSSQYWNMVHGNTPDEVRQDGEGLQIMRTLGRNMAWMIKCLAAGKDAGIDIPEREQRIGTNFIR